MSVKLSPKERKIIQALRELPFRERMFIILLVNDLANPATAEQTLSWLLSEQAKVAKDTNALSALACANLENPPWR